MFVGVEFKRKSGEIVKVLENEFGMGTLKLYGLRGIKKTNDYMVIDEDGFVAEYVEGMGANQMPKICKDMIGKYVDELCVGLYHYLFEA